MTLKRRALSAIIKRAILCGPVPKMRDWRSLTTDKMTRAERNMAFCERYLKVPEGNLVGKPIKLADFQEAFFYSIYDNHVPTKTAIFSIARKNAKTATIAMIVLLHLVGPEAVQNSGICSGARSREQASQVYNLASKMARSSPQLSRIVHAIPSNKKLIGMTMNTEYKALAADGARAHGGSYVLAILDELGQVVGPTDAFVEAITTSQGAYDNALLIVLSTQAASDADMLSVMIDDAERSGDPATVCHLYTAPKGCALLDPKALQSANPALGIFRSRPDAEDQLAKASRMPSAENSARLLILNQRVTRFTPFLAPSIWKANASPSDPRAFVEGDVYGGLDLSLTTDLTALVLAARWEGEWHIQSHFWTPEATLADRAKRDRVPYLAWAASGALKTTPGKAVDYAYVARDISEITDGMNLQTIAFDRYRMTMLKTELDRLGIELPFTPFGQGYTSMGPAVDVTEIEFLQGRVRHGGHEVLTMCAANAVIIQDPAGGRKLDKSKSTGRIDGMVALTMAIGVAGMMATVDEVSMYESSDVRMI